ncbi:MAG: orotate phosphoribosyltransferase [Candidatus Njordarchaeia archaeon]
MERWEKLKRSVSQKLFEIGSIKFGEFVLSSGKISPIYIDLRIIPSFPNVFDLIVEAYISTIKRMEIPVDTIVGIPVGGLPIATLISYKLKKPLIYVRKEAKTHGLGKKIEGNLGKRQNLLIIDDVATTGKSILRAVNILRENGCEPKNALVLIDREQGADKNLEGNGIKLFSFIRITELLDILKQEGKLDQDSYDRIMKYIEMEKSSK